MARDKPAAISSKAATHSFNLPLERYLSGPSTVSVAAISPL